MRGGSINRQALVKRYIELQNEARKLGLTDTPHITRHMSDEEIVRLGKTLAESVKKARNGR